VWLCSHCSLFYHDIAYFFYEHIFLSAVSDFLLCFFFLNPFPPYPLLNHFSADYCEICKESFSLEGPAEFFVDWADSLGSYIHITLCRVLENGVWILFIVNFRCCRRVERCTVMWNRHTLILNSGLRRLKHYANAHVTSKLCEVFIYIFPFSSNFVVREIYQVVRAGRNWSEKCCVDSSFHQRGKLKLLTLIRSSIISHLYFLRIEYCNQNLFLLFTVWKLHFPIFIKHAF
jgi:hypothetical protein